MRARAVALLLALSACHEDATTGIVVEVTSDLALPATTELHLRVSATDGTLLRDLPFHAGDLPARLSLVPGSGAATTVTVEANAPVGATTLRRRATVAFRRDSLLLLRLPLDFACVCHSCPDDQTCEAGTCAPVLKDPATLPPYGPRAPSPGEKMAAPVCGGDAGAPADAGEDAGPARADGAPDLAPPLPDSSADVARLPTDAAAPDAASPAPDLVLADTAAPDTTLARDTAAPDLTAPPPDAPNDLPADSAPAPDLPTVRPEGQPCATSDQCLSGACVDHVCCHTACTGPCLACDRLHTGAADGQCAPVLSGSDPDGDCAADTPMSCGYDGTCNGAGACRFYGTSTQCAAATCNAASSFTPARTCTGAGACAPPAPQDCGLFLCKPAGCPVSCVAQADCISTAYCNGTSCVMKKASLQPCAAGFECLSGSCTLTLVCL